MLSFVQPFGRLARFLGIVVCCAGCRGPVLPVDIVNKSPQAVDVIALVPQRVLMGAATRAYSTTIDPDELWRRSRREGSDRLTSKLRTGTSGWFILMVRPSGMTDGATLWQDHWIRAPFEPTVVTIEPAVSPEGIRVQVATGRGDQVAVLRMTEQELRNWNAGVYATPTDDLSLLDVLDARRGAWPLDFHPRARSGTGR